MTITAEDEHKSKLVDASRVAVSRLRLSVPLEPCDTARGVRRDSLFTNGTGKSLLIVRLEVSDVSTSLHLLIVEIETLIRILNNERVLH